MPMYNLIENSDAYFKTSRSLWQYYGDEPAPDNNSNITDFPADNSNSISFKFKQQITEQTVAQTVEETVAQKMLK